MLPACGFSYVLAHRLTLVDRPKHDLLALAKTGWGSLKCERRDLRVGPIQAEGKPRETQAVGARKYTPRRRGVRAPGLEPGFRRWQRPVITTTLRSQYSAQPRRVFDRFGGIIYSMKIIFLHNKSRLIPN